MLKRIIMGTLVAATFAVLAVFGGGGGEALP